MGMFAIHSSKVIHRDLKPSNILIKDGVCKIGELGQGREVRDDLQSSSMSRWGTHTYRAPEYRNGEFPRGHKAGDVFSFGEIIKFLLAHRMRGGNEFSMKLEELARRCCNTDWNERPSFQDIAHELYCQSHLTCENNGYFSFMRRFGF
jgi:serine/threonine protein kinase